MNYKFPSRILFAVDLCLWGQFSIKFDVCQDNSGPPVTNDVQGQGCSCAWEASGDDSWSARQWKAPRWPLIQQGRRKVEGGGVWVHALHAQSSCQRPPPQGAGRRDHGLGLLVRGHGGREPQESRFLPPTERKLPGLGIMGRGLAPSHTHHRYPHGVQGPKEGSGPSLCLRKGWRSRNEDPKKQPPPKWGSPTNEDWALDSAGHQRGPRAPGCQT